MLHLITLLRVLEVQRVRLHRQLPGLHPGSVPTGAWATPRHIIGSDVQIESLEGRLVRSANPGPIDDGPDRTVDLWDRTGRAAAVPTYLRAGH